LINAVVDLYQRLLSKLYQSLYQSYLNTTKNLFKFIRSYKIKYIESLRQDKIKLHKRFYDAL